MSGKQWFVLGLLGLGIMLVFGALGWVLSQSGPSPRSSTAANSSSASNPSSGSNSSSGSNPAAGIPVSSLGTSKADLQSQFETMGFQFQPSSQASQGRLTAQSKERDQVLELNGTADKVTSLTLATTLVDPQKKTAQVDAMVTTLKQVVPNWDSAAWLNANIQLAIDKGQVETVSGNYRITLKSFLVQGVRPLFLTVQPK